MRTLRLKSRVKDGPARERELETLSFELFMQCFESEEWRRKAELFSSQRDGHDLFFAAWTWGVAHIIDQCSRGKLLILGSDSHSSNN
jgi:hypothetical protein